MQQSKILPYRNAWKHVPRKRMEIQDAGIKMHEYRTMIPDQILQKRIDSGQPQMLDPHKDVGM